MYTVSINKGSNIGLRTAKFDSHFDHGVWSKIQQKRVRDNVQIIKDFLVYDTLFVFSHVNIVSIYDTIKTDWFHYPFFKECGKKSSLVRNVFIHSLGKHANSKSVLGVCNDGTEFPRLDFIHIDKEKGEIRDIHLHE